MSTPNSERPLHDETPPDRRRKWRWWMVGLALLAVAAWFFFGREESQQARLEKEIRRILADVRREDQSSFTLRSIPEAMQNWPPPFPKLATLIMGDDDQSFSGRERLADLGPAAVPILTNLLVTDRSPAVRTAVGEALGETGDTRLIPLLVSAFAKEREVRVQSAILNTLGSMGDERSRPLLISVLQGTNDLEVRRSAASALGNFQSAEALAALTNALIADPHPSIRSSVAAALHGVSDPIVKPALLHALGTDSDESVRVSVIETLANHPGDNTLEALLTILRKEDDASDLGNTGPPPGRFGGYRGQNPQATAVRILSGMTNTVVRAVLVASLSRKSPEVRAEAARSLDRFPGPDTQSALLKLLASDAIADVRTAAIQSLAWPSFAQTNRAVVAGLLETLQKDPAPEVRQSAAKALGSIGEADVVKALRATLETERRGQVQVEAIGGIFRHENASMAKLLMELLGHPNLEIEARAEAVLCLGRTKHPSGEEKLVALLSKDSEAQIRVAAARALGSYDNTNAVRALTVALAADDEPSIRLEAAQALGQLRAAHAPTTVAALITALEKDTDTSKNNPAPPSYFGNSVRSAAAVTLGMLRDPTARLALEKALQRDRNEEVRASAATALGRLGRTEATGRLEAAFRKDRSREVRVNALNSFAVLSGTNRAGFFVAEFETNPAMRRELLPILGRIGSPEIVTLLLKTMSEDGWVDRAAMASALGDAGDARALTPLMSLLAKDQSAQTRAAAATALGLLGRAEAVPALEAALQDRAGTVAQEAAWALGHIGDARAVPALRQALARSDNSSKFPLAFALAEVGDRSAVTALVPLLHSSDEQVRLAGASALAFLDDAQGLKILDHMLHSRESWQRFTALISLLRLSTPEARQALTNCHQSEPILAAVVEAGLRLGGAGAGTNLLATARENRSMTDDYRHFGARALVLFKDPATLPVLLAHAHDPEAEVRRAVRVAIRRIQKIGTNDAPPPAR